MALLAFNKLNTSAVIKMIFQLLDLNLKSFFKKTLRIFRLLLITFEVYLKETFSIN